MAHADTLMYNALKVITEDRNIVGYLKVNDPMALAQARDSLRTFDEEHAPEPPCYEATVWVPLVAELPPDIETPEDAEGMARAAYVTEDVEGAIRDALNVLSSVFVVEQAEVRCEIRRQGSDEVLN
jgi:hypothetical protein